jgi:hypothetical protein
MLKGQELIKWWGEATVWEKEYLIRTRIFSARWWRGKDSNSHTLSVERIGPSWRECEAPGWLNLRDEQSRYFHQSIGSTSDGRLYTSPDSPRRLVEEVEQETIRRVGLTRYLYALREAVTAKMAREMQPFPKYDDWEILALCAMADASTRCLACLLALEDQNGQ